MWEILGIGCGVALAMGFAGAGGQHWAVRVLCAGGFLVGAGWLFLEALFAGKDSPAWDVFGGAVLAFVLVSAVSVVSRLVAMARAKAGDRAGETTKTPFH